jgi:3,4-dihydroxy 2-butanone 4-phosphate synthase/GTP cyclohydrolase II
MSALSSTEVVIEAARNGRMFILVDDENRENEGDLVVPAQMATPEAIAFMAHHGRGLICLALSQDRARSLDLEPMAASNQSRHETAFTVSIEASDGVTTGISAADRARTISAAINAPASSSNLVSPGHVFPIVAKPGGVLIRAGHTEASVDISILAGLNPSAVICEIMRDDGKMARLPDLLNFAELHNMTIGSIADLIRYRRKTEKLVEPICETAVASEYGGDFKCQVFRNVVDGSEHVVLSKGELSKDEPVLVRMHSLNIFSDVVGDILHGSNGTLQSSMRMIADEGCGAVIILRDSRADILSRWVKEHRGNGGPHQTGELRDYGLGAQILNELGVKRVRLISNTMQAPVGLDGFGFEIQDRVPLPSQ